MSELLLVRRENVGQETGVIVAMESLNGCKHAAPENSISTLGRMASTLRQNSGEGVKS